MRGVLLVLAALLAWLPAAPAQAHKPSDSYLSITVADGADGVVRGRWDIALRDLDFALGLDADGDGALRWGELRARHAAIAAYASARLAVLADGAPCTLVIGAQLIDEHTDGAYSVLPLGITCPPTRPSTLEIQYALFADLDPQHRGLLNLRAAGATQVAVLGPHAPRQRFELQAPDRWRQFVDYAREGVWHIWIGFDHVLFLLALLLPAVLVWRARQWQAAAGFGPAFWDVFRIVTSFTLAHSITLTLAALGLVTLPSRAVEAAIALSVVLAALNNLRPLAQRGRWLVAFAFGLIHGFGFASVLVDLGLPRDALALALVGFNLGVEAGQLAIVALFLPLAYALRRTAFYRRWVMLGGSLAVAVLAAVWLVERAFDVELMPF